MSFARCASTNLSHRNDGFSETAASHSISSAPSATRSTKNLNWQTSKLNSYLLSLDVPASLVSQSAFPTLKDIKWHQKWRRWQLLYPWQIRSFSFWRERGISKCIIDSDAILRYQFMKSNIIARRMPQQMFIFQWSSPSCISAHRTVLTAERFGWLQYITIRIPSEVNVCLGHQFSLKYQTSYSSSKLMSPQKFNTEAACRTSF